jgi:hypothetical protein
MLLEKTQWIYQKLKFYVEKYGEFCGLRVNGAF